MIKFNIQFSAHVIDITLDIESVIWLSNIIAYNYVRLSSLMSDPNFQPRLAKYWVNLRYLIEKYNVDKANLSISVR